ncbi:dynamin family protein [Brachyspira pulli]|uniref:dynamin family protein n=1 Tax=Brachyspira pulli TaxID=310721 RepID=UPI003006C070
MINNQKKFIDILEQLESISKDSDIDYKNISFFINIINNTKFLIPIVGDFSAGKSTLLNHFIGKDILKTNELPETAVATELYYSEKEYNIAVDKNGNEIEIYDLSKENVKNYSYIKRYINSENLKKISPIILVDMPGFDSPSENHNKSIISYLNKGIYYIVLSSMEEGEITKSLITQIKNIINFNKDFSIFITKTEFYGKEDIELTKDKMKKTLKSISINKNIETISIKDINIFDSFINKLNIENIFSNIYLEPIKDTIYDLKSSINIKISALKKDKKSNEYVIRELEEAINKIERKKAELIEDEKNKSYENEVNKILKEISKELDNNIDYIVNLALEGNSIKLQKELSNIIQPILIEKTNDVLNNINLDIGAEISKDIKSLDEVLANYNIPNFIKKIEMNLDKYKDNIKIPKIVADDDTKNKYKLITSTLAILTNVVNPLIEILIVFLPEILNLCFGIIQEKNYKENVKEKIIDDLTRIKRELKIEITKIIKENNKVSIENLSSSFDEELRRKKEEIEEVEKQINKNGNIDKIISKLQSNIYKIDEISSCLYE